MVRVTVYDDFFKTEMSGEFESLQDAIEFYAVELDTTEEEVNIIKVEVVK